MQDFGVIGLGTMGANLARNAARKGVRVSLFNRTPERVEAFLSDFGDEGTLDGFHSYKKFVRSLSLPRAILLMVSAGNAVDDILGEILPHLSRGDVIMDGGNSYYRDTQRRVERCAKRGVSYLGIGVSGGEEGALRGPSLMSGGDRRAYRTVESLLKKIAASDGEGGKCVSFMGPDGAGHFVKMVHNGIEYAVMQLIAESYDLLRAAGVGSARMGHIFSSWMTGDLRSYLMEVTATVLRKKDEETRKFLVDLIADRARHKGTGSWTVQAAAEYGVAIPTISAALDARFLSALPDRAMRGRDYPVSLLPPVIQKSEVPSAVRSALEVSTLFAYAEGFDLLAAASARENWRLPLVEIARIWKGGCIIRSSILDAYLKAYRGSAAARKRGKHAILRRLSGARQRMWRFAVLHGIARGVPVPALASTVAYYDTMRASRLPQNLIQAQRDFFGAHGYERTDREGIFHTPWDDGGD